MFGGVELETVFIPLTEAGSSLLQTSKFSMTSFYVTSFICSSVRATLTIFSMTSALVQNLSKYKFCSSVWVNKENLSK